MKALVQLLAASQADASLSYSIGSSISLTAEIEEISDEDAAFQERFESFTKASREASVTVGQVVSLLPLLHKRAKEDEQYLVVRHGYCDDLFPEVLKLLDRERAVE